MFAKMNRAVLQRTTFAFGKRTFGSGKSAVAGKLFLYYSTFYLCFYGKMTNYCIQSLSVFNS